MNRKKLCLLIGVLALVVIVVSVSVIVGFRDHNADYQTMRELFESRYPNVYCSGMADYVQFTYDELWAEAHTIAVVTPVDVLSTENSYGIAESGDRFYNAHSVRELEAITFFKNSRELNDVFEIVETCAMLNDGSIVGMENCYPMQEGEVYLVFLCDSGWGYPIVMSADNGKFDLTNLRLNLSWRQPLLAEALTDLNLMPVTRSVDEAMTYFGEATYVTEIHYKNAFDAVYAAHDWEEMTVKSQYTAKNMEQTVEYARTETGYLYHVGEYIFESVIAP